jgi:predicted lipoprotein with Yx(FWY)xxD motif
MNHHSPAVALTSRRPLWLAALGLLTLIGFVLLHPISGSAARTATGPTVSTASTSLGRVLVDVRGRTLYLFDNDKNGKSSCTGKCATFWPPLIAAAKPHAGTGAKASLLGTTKRADGRLQVTYNHHPLYTFVKDTKKGQTNGENVVAFGAEWYAVSPAGAEVQKSMSSGGGY